MTRPAVRLASVLAVCAALAVPVAFGAAATPDPPAIVSIEPSVLEIAPGERRLVFVRVHGVPASGLAAFQVELSYDPHEIRVLDPNAGFGLDAFAPLGGSPLCASVRRELECTDPAWIMTTGGRRAVGISSADPDRGRLTIAYGTSGSVGPLGGDGTLAVLEVVGLATARARIDVDAAILADADDPPRRYRVALPHPGDRRTKPALDRRGGGRR